MLDTIRVDLKKLRDAPKIAINSPKDVVKLAKEMEDYDREYFKLIDLDTKNRVIAVENIAVGSLSAAIIHPREVLKGALLANAASVLLLHNHPSGISQPSHEDDMIISRLRDAFNIMGVDVADAIILAKENNGYYSYKENMRLDKMTEGGSQRIMEDSATKKDDACNTSMRAAISIIRKYCPESIGDEKEIEIGGIKFKVSTPLEVIQIRETPDLTYEQRVVAVQQSKWATNEAKGLCSKLFGQETVECIERVSRKLAEGMVRV